MLPPLPSHPNTWLPSRLTTPSFTGGGMAISVAIFEWGGKICFFFYWLDLSIRKSVVVEVGRGLKNRMP